VYALVRPLLFALDPERAHDLTLGLLHGAWRLPGVAALAQRLGTARTPLLPVEVMGLQFPNPVGLAAGLDKNACCPAAFHAFGFGFVELGTVTPRPQPGNPRPRMFRLARQQAILNRMGFNSDGLDAFLANLRNTPRHGLIGINLGKNKDTPAEQALDDYLTGLRAVYAHADYVTVNISSPNTPGLRALQDEAALTGLLAGLKAEQQRQTGIHGRHVPIALKIAPDLDDHAIDSIARLLLEHELDAVIATNTTIARPGLEAEPLARESGGLSGQPLRELSTRVIRQLHGTLQGRIPIIGVGGIMNADDAWEKLVAGAELVQIYSALIYRGPGVVRSIVAGLAEKVRQQGAVTLAEALAGARRASAGLPSR
jgi:dihydroorotate dehydrogenase